MPRIFGILRPDGEPGRIAGLEQILAHVGLAKLQGLELPIFLAVTQDHEIRLDLSSDRETTVLIRDGQLPDERSLHPSGSAPGHIIEARNLNLTELEGAWTHLRFSAADMEQRLAIDRFGQHRLVFFHTRDGELVFASDIDTLRCHPGVETPLSAQAIYHYLFFHVIPSPGSIFKGIGKLPAAHQLLYNRSGYRLQRYWTAEFATHLDGTPEEKRNAVVPLVNSAVQRCGTTPDTGAFLSGGLDSSTVCGSLQSMQKQPTKAFSVGFDAEGFDEIKYAEAAARHFGLDHHVHYITPQEVTESVPLVAQTYDEPFGNSSAVPTYVCARFARSRGINLLLAGDGGDEIFSGNTRYLKQKIFQSYFAIPEFLRHRVLEPLFESRGKNSRLGHGPLRKISRYIDQALVPLPDRLQSFNLLRMLALDEVIDNEFLAAIEPEQPLEMMRDEWQALDGAHYQDRMLFLDWKFTLADNDIRKVTEMTRLAGLAVAYPLLDNDVVALATSIPPSVRMPDGKLRHFYRESVRSFLPPETLSKSKHGFGLPFGDWALTDPGLREITMDSLSSLRRRRILRDTFLQKLERQHMQEHADFYGNMVWVLMMLELWMDAHGVSE